jgi:hypothetical protein
MNLHDPTAANPARRFGMARIALGLATVWFCVHVAIYAVGMCRLESVFYRHLEHALKHFFGWQAIGFLVVAIIAGSKRPSIAGRVLVAYLILSSVALLACSQDAVASAKFMILLLWMACTTRGMREAIRRGAGERYATYGIAAASVYAALVPMCFFLGLCNGITRWNATVLAVATALPGVFLWLRDARKAGMAARFRQGRSVFHVGWVERSEPHHELPGNGEARARPTLPISPSSKIDWPDFSILECFFLEAIWLILAIEFVGASTAELASDTVRVHLPYMLRLIADHGLSHQYACWHRLQPMAVQTYSATIAAAGSIAAAKWFSWLALAVLSLLVSEEVRRRCDSRPLGLFAGAAVLSCPLLAGLAQSLYVDHVLALLCTAGFVVLFRALSPPDRWGGSCTAAPSRKSRDGSATAIPTSEFCGAAVPAAQVGPAQAGETPAPQVEPCLRGVLLSAAIMGCMVQVKYTGLIFCVVWGLFLAVVLLRKCGGRVALRWSATAGTLLVAAALPWYVYVYAGTGNPVYPYLNNWFPSPYWAEGVTLQQVFEANFKLSPGVVGAATFPWTATYHTARFVEGYDGILGFWALALAPCWFLQRRGEMAIVSIAMIAGVVIYTPYVRYWLPAYPLLVASCVAAAGSSLPSIAWRPRWRYAPLVTGTAAVLLLLLPAPLLALNMPWDAYAERISAEQHLAQSFHEYQAIRQLNAILAPHDGVLCTGVNGVYLVGGRPYELSCWWSSVHHIHDRASFVDFCRRNEIRYWMVNHTSLMSGGKFARRDIAGEFCTEARMVSAAGTVVVYDMAPDAARRWRLAEQRELPSTLDPSEKRWNPSIPFQDWTNLAANRALPAKDAVVLDGKARIGHHIDPEIPGGLCRVGLSMSSKNRTDPLFDLVWFDADGKLLNCVSGAAQGRSDYQASIYAAVPPQAKHGWVYLREWQQKPIELKRASVTFWKSQTAVATARRNNPSSETTGVR